ncbi:MAG: hypothetical protein ACJ790_21690 [Myxococcaceae bacterium]
MALIGILFFSVVVCACDNNQKHYDKALAQYDALISAHRPLADEQYSEVVKELSVIPSSDPLFPKAKRIIDAIETARKPLPPRPLATVGSGSGDALEQKRGECAELAKAYGEAADGGREAARVKLAACREELERVSAAQAHADEPGATPEVHLMDGGVVETLRIECAQWRAQLTLPNVDRDRVLKSLQLNSDKLKMLDAPPGPCAYDAH